MSCIISYVFYSRVLFLVMDFNDVFSMEPRRTSCMDFQLMKKIEHLESALKNSKKMGDE